MVDGERFVDPELGDLINKAEQLLRPAEAPASQREILTESAPEPEQAETSSIQRPRVDAAAETSTSSTNAQENLRDELDKTKAELQSLKQDNAALKFVNALRKKQVETRNTEIANLKKPVQKQEAIQKQPQKTEMKPHEFAQNLRRYPQTGSGSGRKNPWT